MQTWIYTSIVDVNLFANMCVTFPKQSLNTIVRKYFCAYFAPEYTKCKLESWYVEIGQGVASLFLNVISL